MPSCPRSGTVSRRYDKYNDRANVRVCGMNAGRAAETYGIVTRTRKGTRPWLPLSDIGEKSSGSSGSAPGVGGELTFLAEYFRSAARARYRAITDRC
jgi:hypothetical protein